MKITCGLICVAFGLFLGAPLSRASTSYCAGLANNLVVNCAFGTGDFTGWTLTGNDTPGQEGNLYGVESGQDPDGSFPPNGDTYQAYFGDLVSNATTISQTISTVVGVEYFVSFYLAQDTAPGGAEPPNSNEFIASFGGTTLEDLTAMPVQEYTYYSFSAIATSTSSVLSFTLGNDLGFFLLDDMNVSTPEPAAWILMLGGCMTLIFVRRFRNAMK
jgi:hypothetical protein